MIAFTLPPATGARLPTLIVSLSAPVFTVVAPSIVCTFTVSAPVPVFSVVVPVVESTCTVSAPSFVFSVVVPAWVLAIVNVSPPEPRLTFTDSSVP